MKKVRDIQIITYGCKVNQYEAAVIENNLSGSSVPDGKNLVIIMSCCVTARAEKECCQTIKRLLKQKEAPEIIVASCYVKKDRERLTREFPQVIFCSDYSQLKNIMGIKTWQNKLDSFFEHCRAFVKVQDGCDQFCSYCLVPYVRPGNKSRPLPEIEEEVQGLIINGYSEIVLTGIRLGKYEFSDGKVKIGLEGLLKKLLELVEKNGWKDKVRFRLSSLEIGEVTPELIELFRQNPFNLCGHFHLPLQSASERILRMMNRPYNQKFYLGVISQIKKNLPDAAITTDIIVGFPTETEEDFQQTREFVEEVGFSRLHIFSYSRRPGTLADRLSGHLPWPVIQQRRKELVLVDKTLRERFVKKFIDRQLPAVLDGKKSVLTDNYIHLSLEKTSGLSRIFSVKIVSPQQAVAVTK